MDVLAFSETKLMGKKDECFGNILKVKSRVSLRARTKEWATLLLQGEL